MPLGGSLAAQEQVRWSLSTGGTLAMGTFGSIQYDKNTLMSNCGLYDVDSICGGAGAGLSIGSELLHPILDNLDFVVSADLHYNPSHSDAKTLVTYTGQYIASYIEYQLLTAGYSKPRCTSSVDHYPSYFDLPIMGGIRYTIGLPKGMSLFLYGSAGVNIRYVSPTQFTFKINYSLGGDNYGGSMRQKMTYGIKGSPAFRIGVGIQFAEQLSFTAAYYYLGKGKVIGKMTTDVIADGAEPNTIDQVVGYVTPTLLALRLTYSY